MEPSSLGFQINYNGRDCFRRRLTKSSFQLKVRAISPKEGYKFNEGRKSGGPNSPKKLNKKTFSDNIDRNQILSQFISAKTDKIKKEESRCGVVLELGHRKLKVTDQSKRKFKRDILSSRPQVDNEEVVEEVNLTQNQVVGKECPNQDYELNTQSRLSVGTTTVKTNYLTNQKADFTIREDNQGYSRNFVQHKNQTQHLEFRNYLLLPTDTKVLSQNMELSFDATLPLCIESRKNAFIKLKKIRQQLMSANPRIIRNSSGMTFLSPNQHNFHSSKIRSNAQSADRLIQSQSGLITFEKTSNGLSDHPNFKELPQTKIIKKGRSFSAVGPSRKSQRIIGSSSNKIQPHIDPLNKDLYCQTSNINLTQQNNGGLKNALKKPNGTQIGKNQQAHRYAVKLAANDRSLMSTQYLQKLKPVKYRDTNKSVVKKQVVSPSPPKNERSSPAVSQFIQIQPVKEIIEQKSISPQLSRPLDEKPLQQNNLEEEIEKLKRQLNQQIQHSREQQILNIQKQMQYQSELKIFRRKNELLSQKLLQKEIGEQKNPLTLTSQSEESKK